MTCAMRPATAHGARRSAEFAGRGGCGRMRMAWLAWWWSVPDKCIGQSTWPRCTATVWMPLTQAMPVRWVAWKRGPCAGFMGCLRCLRGRWWTGCGLDAHCVGSALPRVAVITSHADCDGSLVEGLLMLGGQDPARRVQRHRGGCDGQRHGSCGSGEGAAGGTGVRCEGGESDPVCAGSGGSRAPVDVS